MIPSSNSYVVKNKIKNNYNVVFGDEIAASFSVSPGWLDDGSNKARVKDNTLAYYLSNQTKMFWQNCGKNAATLPSLYSSFNTVINDTHYENKVNSLTDFSVSKIVNLKSDSKTLVTSSMVQADDGSYLCACTTNDTLWKVRVYKSTNGINFTVVKTIEEASYKNMSNTMTKHNGNLYLSILRVDLPTASVYRSDIYKSIDNGGTWTKVFSSNDYGVSFSNVLNGNKCAACLYHVPVTGYTNAYVDFGWYNFDTDNIEVITRLATTGDEAGTFPSEVFFYKKALGNIVACIRWGEYPQIPYIKLKESANNGVSWSSMGVTWDGYAGMANIAEKDGIAYCCGYYKPSVQVAYTCIWIINKETGSIIKTHYPFGKVAVQVATGNGQIITGLDGQLYGCLGDGDQKFIRIKISNDLVVDNIKPILLIHAGIRDVCSSDTVNTIKNNFTAIFNLCSEFRVVVMSLPYKAGAFLTKIQEINTWLLNTCTSLGYVFVDYFSYGQAHNTDSNRYYDEINPKSLGISEIVNNYIIPALVSNNYI